MTINDLIKNKDYDFIEFRFPYPQKEYSNLQETVLLGFCKSKSGELISLDYDSYDKNEEVIFFKEWSNEEALNGLTVVVSNKLKIK